MAVAQGSTLFAGDVSQSIIYQIKNGIGFQWKDYVKTEINVSGKPRQLTKAKHADDPLEVSVRNPRMAADFATTPTITIDGRQLNVTKLMYNQLMKPEDWMETFPEYQPTGTAIDLAMNPEVQAVVFDLAMNAIKTQVNKLHSVGDDALGGSDPLRFYDGFVTLLLADGDATEVGTGTTIALNNVLARVKELINAIPERLAMETNLKAFCSFSTYKMYQDARAETQTYLPSTDIAANKVLLQAYGSNVELVPILGIPADVIFVTKASTDDSSNLVQGVWVESDMDALKMYKEVEADEDWLILMKFYIGVQYKTGEDIFYVKGV